MIAELVPIAEACLLQTDECLGRSTFVVLIQPPVSMEHTLHQLLCPEFVKFEIEGLCKATSCKCALCTANTGCARLPFFPSHRLFRPIAPNIQARITSQDVRLQRKTWDREGRIDMAMPFTSI